MGREAAGGRSRKKYEDLPESLCEEVADSGSSAYTIEICRDRSV